MTLTPEQLPALATADSFQSRVHPWLEQCFGSRIAADTVERNHRFLEEALELVQALGCTQSEAHQLVDYVFNRDSGKPSQEVGGVMVTLAALCLANNLNMHASAESELARIWTKIETIRAKQAAKPPHSPLPVAARAAGETTVEGWLPIETAPRDGSPILIANDRMVHEVRWMISSDKGAPEGAWFVGGYSGSRLTWKPSHWQRLPSPVSAALPTGGNDA